jgi:hypothetical protein
MGQLLCVEGFALVGHVNGTNEAMQDACAAG